ncbi:SDR family oxidoreductase [Umezawaea endophytica]|uniref:SDR family oxidoreductase n=1 Tax=Umezawaea endophytica TaxID=1654476 RepID=A0A9X2VLD0_9PSEU|nr:SDR family oxidoreductase [Umezawaea endophytica]MCS7478735.1 SDR family oxidoreductase [Umezawaea endophytica]
MRISPDDRTVVVTGASSGLGKACALHLDRLGYRVFAGVRRDTDGDALVAASTSGGLRPLVLDVTDPAAVQAAVKTVGGGLWGLVNNAGVCVPGPLECLSPQRLRDQLETNVVGAATVTSAFLPLLREARGRIVNVSSGLGRIASPFLGAYAASQFAKEGLSDALRRELRPFGVAVAVVQPGAIMTPIWTKLAAQGDDLLDTADAGVADLYRAPFRHFLAANDERARRSGTVPDDFARTVARALAARRPKSRYQVGPDARAGAVLYRLLPDSLLDLVFAKAASPGGHR